MAQRRSRATDLPPAAAPVCARPGTSRGRLLNVGGTVQYEYLYGGLNRRTRRYQQSTWPDPSVSEFYFIAGWQLVEVRSDTNSRCGDPLSEPERAETVKEQYVWSQRYIDSPFCRGLLSVVP